MWSLLILILLPFFILVIIEESIEFFVNRYVLGPAKWEGRVKIFFQDAVAWAKRKLKKAPSLE